MKTRFHILTLTKDLGATTSVIHPILFETDRGLILFDAGYPHQAGEIESELKKWGFSLDQLAVIAVSHHDHDHVGSLKALVDRLPQVVVAANEEEAKSITGKQKPLRLAQAEEYNKGLPDDQKAWGEQFAAYLRTIETARVDRFVGEGEELAPGLKVLNTFGHTTGHLSLLLEDENLLFAGDALAIEEGKLGAANPHFALDLPEAIRSIQKIRNRGFQRIVCYHGGEYQGDVAAALDDLVRTLG